MTSQSEHEHNTLSCTEEQVAPLEAFSSVNKDALYAKISQKKKTCRETFTAPVQNLVY